MQVCQGRGPECNASTSRMQPATTGAARSRPTQGRPAELAVFRLSARAAQGFPWVSREFCRTASGRVPQVGIQSRGCAF